MPHRRRALAGLIIAALAGAMLAAPASAAKPPPVSKAPSFAVTLNKASVGGFGGPKVYLAFTFTSTSTSKNAAIGFARFATPSVARPGSPTGFLGWAPALQQDEPLEPGYFRIEATTCASATLHAFTPNELKAEQSIEIAFDCQPGQAFVLHWYPTSEYQNLDGIGNNDIWQFPVATRSKLKDAWTPQTAPQLQVDVFDLRDIINLPLIKPPVKLIDVVPVITEPEAPRIWALTGNGYIDVQPIQHTVNVTTAYRADTGAQLIVGNVEGARLDQTVIQVTSCLDLAGTTIIIDGQESVFNMDCADLGLVVKIDRPWPGIFQNLDETALSQTSVLFNVDAFSSVAVDWDAAGTECRYRGGQFLPAEPGVATHLWICDFVDLSDMTRYTDALSLLRQAEYCPTGTVREDPVTIANRDVVCVG